MTENIKMQKALSHQKCTWIFKVKTNSYLRTLLTYCFFGIFASLGFAPFNIFPLFLFAFAWFFVKINSSNKIHLKPIFLFFLVFHIANLYWLIYPLTINLKKHFILIPFAITIIPAYFSIQLSLSMLALRYFYQIYAKVLIFSAVFCVTTYIYGHFSLGFPWIMPGYIWGYHEIFLQTLSIYGIYGLSFITMLIASLLGTAFIFYNKKDRDNCLTSIILVTFFMIFLVIFGVDKLHSNKTQNTAIKTRVIQCNLSQKEKNDRKSSVEILKKHVSLSLSDEKIDIIVWPEATIPFLYHKDLKELHNLITTPLKKNSFLISGAIRKDLATEKVYNSAIFINDQGKNTVNYDKIRLVPFGEYVPFRLILPFQGIANEIGDFDTGIPPRIITIKQLNIATAICYEAVFSLDFFPRDKNIRKAIDLIINLTNDGWFGYTSEPFQHLQIVRARAVEMGTPLIRATNYGISAVFDPYGREISRIDINQSGFIDFYIPKKAPTQTPYSKYGDSIFWIMISIAVSLAILLDKKSIFKKLKAAKNH